MILRTAWMVTAALLALASHGYAQILFTTTGSITGNPSTDLSTLGTYVDAVGANDGGGSTYGANITVGDTIFHSIFSNSADISISNAGFGTDGSGSTASAFKTVLNDVDYTGDFNPSDFSQATVTLSNLRVGDIYQVEVFTLGGFGAEVVGSNSVQLNNEYVIGDFTATGTIGQLTTQTFTFNNGDAGVGEVNAIVLRNITNLPEPGTYALMGLGLGSLIFVGRFRRLARATT